MATIKRAVPITLLAVAVVALPISAYESRLTLINNVMNLNLTAAALGVLSTLNFYYFIGLVATLALFALSINYRSNTLTTISTLVIIIYFVDYPLLLSPFPSYLPDGTIYATETLAISLFDYSNIAKWLYTNGAYPIAFIWGSIISNVINVQPIYLSSAYGIFEPITLGLISYIIAKRLINKNSKNIHLALLSMLIFTALIWSYQFHFSPQDFNIVVLMLASPLLPRAIEDDLGAIILIAIVVTTLTLGHATEDPILLATLFSLLILRVAKRCKDLRSLVLIILIVTIVIFIMYSIYIVPLNIISISNLFSTTSIMRVIKILTGKVSHSVYFALTNSSSVYPLRSLVYRYELYGGYAIALFELISIIILYFLLWFKEPDNYRQAYVSLALGGLLVDALITLALGTYSNRLAVYSAPILAGLLMPYLAQLRNYLKYTLIGGLIALSFISMIFSSLTIYWDYSAGNPVTYRSYALIYSFGYHYNLESIYVANWLSYYELLDFSHNINVIYKWPYSNLLFDYNKNDLIYIANDISINNYLNILNKLKSISIVFNDNVNLITLG